MVQADRVLKEIGKEKAQEYYKVWIKLLYEFGELISAIERMTKSSSFVCVLYSMARAHCVEHPARVT